MSDVSAIEWTDATWNPVTGCTRVSPGCAHCYIERTPPFRMAGRRFEIVGQESTTGVTLHPDRLEQPLHWRKPRRVFVCSLADLFHDDVSDEYLLDVFETMSRADEHVFQVLTKRPERMRAFMEALPLGNRGSIGFDSRLTIRARMLGVAGALPNVWLGVSIENARYTWRADVLREVPAAVRFISAEPLLDSLFTYDRRDDGGSRLAHDRRRTGVAGTADLGGSRRTATDAVTAGRSGGRSGPLDPLGTDAGANDGSDLHGLRRDPAPLQLLDRGRAPLDLTEIDWVIIGGESGPGARPFQLEHAREIIRACREHDVAPFVKQLGAHPVGKSYIPATHGPSTFTLHYGDVPLNLRDRKGGRIEEWPADLQIREFPRTADAA
jgi:protein gp37